MSANCQAAYSSPVAFCLLSAAEEFPSTWFHVLEFWSCRRFCLFVFKHSLASSLGGMGACSPLEPVAPMLCAACQLAICGRGSGQHHITSSMGLGMLDKPNHWLEEEASYGVTMACADGLLSDPRKHAPSACPMAELWNLATYLLPKTPSSFPSSSHPSKACGLCGEDIGTHHVWPLLTQVLLKIPSITCQPL